MTKNFNLANDVKTFLEELKDREDKPLYEMTPEEAREFLLSVQRKNYEEIEADALDRKIVCTAGEVDVRVVKPLNYTEKLPVVVYAHGGGWVMGGKEVYDMPVKKIACMAECAVVFVDYKLAPEYPYPAALNEVFGILEYVSRYPDEFDIDEKRIAVAGDSAGGNLAAVCALKAAYEGKVDLKAQVLIYPVTDASMNTKSYDEFKNGPWLTKKAMEYFWDSYIPDKKKREDIYASPLNASLEELKNLPPALILTAENDVLRDEGEEYARKLDEAGVSAASLRVNSTIHDFMMLNALSNTASVNASYESVCAFLKRNLNKK